MRPDGSRRERLTSDELGYAGPVVSPDGQSIAVASGVGGSWGSTTRRHFAYCVL